MRHLSLIIIALFALTCTANSQTSASARKLSSAELSVVDRTSEVTFGHRASLRTKDIQAIIVHSTYYLGPDSFNIEGVLKQFRRYNVCSHYIIGRDGTIYKCVAENHVAYHAGRSRIPDTNLYNVNDISIGIEIINSPSQAPTMAQYKSLARLVKDIRSRYDISYVVRHSDIAPQRKTDPWNFDWKSFKVMAGIY